MKIALIYPKGAFFGTNRKLLEFWEEVKKISQGHLWSAFGIWSGFSIGLLVIAALTPKNFRIKLIDENYENIDFNERYDLVGISFMTQQAQRAYEIAGKFRSRGIKVVLGGIHATVLSEEAKQHCDSVVIGEAENVWQQLLADFEKGRLKEYYRSESMVDITRSPIPRCDLLNPAYYRVAWIQASRGCPRDCEFCAASNVFGHRYRHKTVSQIEKEIIAIKKIWNNIIIGFADDNMLVDRVYAERLIKRIARHNIRWFVQTDISVAEDDKLLKLLSESGCMMLFVGFESTNKQSLTAIDKTGWKRRQFDNYKGYIEKIQSYGMGVLGAFILGLDTDDESIFNKTSDFILDNHLYGAQVTVLTPLPGTRLRERLKKENRILTNPWSDYSLTTVAFIPKNMTVDELQDGLLGVYKSVYNKEANMDRLRYYKEIYRKKYIK
ncbi:MAG: radical SAM protein [Candidatus Omnitrophota bacterium]